MVAEKAKDFKKAARTFTPGVCPMTEPILPPPKPIPIKDRVPFFSWNKGEVTRNQDVYIL